MDLSCMIRLKLLWPCLSHGREANVSSWTTFWSWLWCNFGSQLWVFVVGLGGSRTRVLLVTPPSKQHELQERTLIACHVKHVTIWLFLWLKTNPLEFFCGTVFVAARNFQIARTARTWSGSWRSCWTTTLQVFQNLAPMMITMELVQMHISCARPSRCGVFRCCFRGWELPTRGWVSATFCLRKPSGGTFGGLPSTMQELEPIWWRLGMSGTMLRLHHIFEGFLGMFHVVPWVFPGQLRGSEVISKCQNWQFSTPTPRKST